MTATPWRSRGSGPRVGPVGLQLDAVAGGVGAHWRQMWVVGATTATRATRPSESIRWATCSPNVVLPAAGVAEARKASPAWAKTAAAAACCQARRGRAVGQEGSERRAAGRRGASIWYVTGARQARARSDDRRLRHRRSADVALCTSSIVTHRNVTHFSDPGCPWAWSASPAPRRAELALRRPARLAPRDDRPDRERRRLRVARLHRRRARRAATAPSASAGCRSPPSRASTSTARGRCAASSSPPAGSHPEPRVRRLPRAAVRAVHEHARPRGPGRPARGDRLGARASTPTRSSPRRRDPETEAAFAGRPRRGPHRRGQPDRVPGQVAPTPTAASATRRRA